MSRPKGQDHHRAVLTDAEVDTMRDLREEGWSLGQLALKFEVSKSQVARIVRCLQRAG